MATTELSPESLYDALRAILARGEYPSMAKVRVELGTTASQQTLTRHMKTAWQGLADQMGSGLPEGLPRVVVDAAHRFYEEARGYANAELESQKAAMQEREAALTAELEDARQRIAVLDGQVRHLQQRTEATEAKAQEIKSALEDSQAQHEHAQERAQSLEATLEDQRTRATEQRQQLTAEHERQIASLEKERARCQAGWDREIERSDEQQKTWAKQIDEARQALRAAESKHDAAESRWRDEVSHVQDALEASRAHASDQQFTIQRLTDAQGQAEKARDDAERRSEKLTEDYDTEIRVLKDHLDRANAGNVTLRLACGMKVARTGDRFSEDELTRTPTVIASEQVIVSVG